MSGSTETQVWKMVSENPNWTAAQLGPRLKAVSKKQLVDALNALLAKDLVKVSKTGDNKLVWKAVDIGDAKAKNAMAGDERMVFSAVEASGNQGIWSRTITSQTNLPNAVVTKIVTKLLSSKQIKMVKSVKHPTRKMYMASHIEPSVDLTGGPWYTDFELDPTFIGFVRGACLKFVVKKSFPNPDDESPTAALFPCTATGVDRYPNIHDITRFIKTSKITEVNLLPEHIEEVMDVLIYEGLVERLAGTGTRTTASAANDDSEDSDNDGGKKRGKQSSSSKKRRKSTRSDDEDSEDEGRKRKKKSKRATSDSESGSDNSDNRGRRSNSRKHKRRRDSSSESESDSSSDDDDRSSKRKRKNKKGKSKSSCSRSRLDDSDTMATESDDNARNKEDGEGDDVDLDTAFGHLFGSGSVYRAIRQERVGLGWSQAPCGRCPQLEFCEDGGPINPKGCKYYGDWLNQVIGD